MDPIHLDRDLLKVFGSEALATLRCGLWPLARLHRLPEPLPGASSVDRPPVVLLHGYLGHREMMRPLARALLEAGFPHVERVGYPSTVTTLERIVQRLDHAIRPLAENGPVDLVGHSLGAVACRAWIKLWGGAPYVRRFVSLGGPHHGTSLYRLVPPWLKDALDPRGPWVERLARGPEPVPTIVIRARYDHQVFPPERARIDGVQEVVIGGRGHNGLLWSSTAHRAIISALTREAVGERSVRLRLVE